MRMRTYMLLATGIIVADVVSKWWILHARPWLVVVNYGVSWGIGSQGILSGMLFGFLALLVAAIFVISARVRFLKGLNILPEVLLVSGALANILDRLMHVGGVVDFIDLGNIGLAFPLFNLADIAVVSGVCLLLLRELVYEKV
ncbi:TPA: hypothetical protein DCW54_03595 [Candidatus Dependentiae bacterium]|nr:hypothetical protein [Candidatus Dependentiae bacterium]